MSEEKYFTQDQENAVREVMDWLIITPMSEGAPWRSSSEIRGDLEKYLESKRKPQQESEPESNFKEQLEEAFYAGRNGMTPMEGGASWVSFGDWHKAQREDARIQPQPAPPSLQEQIDALKKQVEWLLKINTVSNVNDRGFYIDPFGKARLK